LKTLYATSAWKNKIQYQLKVITPRDNPVFPRNKPTSAHRNISNIERPKQQLRLIVVNVDLAVVQGTQNPGLDRMKIDGLDTVGPAGQKLLDFCPFDLHTHLSVL